MFDEFLSTVEQLIRKAPTAWLLPVCETLRSLPADANSDLFSRDYLRPLTQMRRS
jgi:hypothetical protein